MSQLQKELDRRRTFAIISHPDAGKTTLTEKLLLFSGAGVSLICIFAALISILKVIRLEPAIVFKG